MYGYIYETTNLINGMKYIGMHKSSVFDTKYKGSGILISRAFNKYGIENFSCKILKECFDKEDLYQSEIDFISYYNATNNPNYYNIANGGQGGDTSAGLDELALQELKSRKAIYFSTKGRIWINNGNQEKMIYPNELDYFQSIGFTKGKLPFSEEHKKKISRPGINKGRKWSKTQESKDKVRGSKNPMYGSTFKWVNDGVRNYRWDINKEIPDNYILGKIRRNKL